VRWGRGRLVRNSDTDEEEAQPEVSHYSRS
jgi:hypothetical protein